MSPMRVLVVEDERVLAGGIAAGLRSELMAVDVTYDGDTALERLAVNDYDVVVLDRDLPVVHGDDVCRALVAAGAPTRVLMLTAAGELTDRVAGLELGARVRALGRRARLPAPPVLERAGIRLDPARREASRDGRPLALRGKEFGILEELLRADGAVVSAEQLLERRGTRTSTRSPTWYG